MPSQMDDWVVDGIGCLRDFCDDHHPDIRETGFRNVLESDDLAETDLFCFPICEKSPEQFVSLFEKSISGLKVFHNLSTLRKWTR